MRRTPRQGFVSCSLAVVVSLSCVFSAAPVAADFALQDGDVVVFLGDSNTASLGYHKVVENYTLMRFPDRDVRFINAGIGGDWAANAVNRLQTDVFDHGATVLFVTFAPNDLFHANPGQTAQETYNQAIIDILAACAAQDPPLRVYVNTYPYVTPPGGSEPTAYYNMSVQGAYISLVSGQHAIDIWNGMRNLAIAPAMANATAACVAAANAECDEAAPNNFRSKACLQRCPAFGDGLHMTDEGKRAMGYVILKGLNAPEMVSEVVINISGSSATLTSSNGATVTDLAWNSSTQTLSFDRLDQGQPFVFHYLTNYSFNLYVPFRTLAPHRLKITNLPTGNYSVTMRGKAVGTFASVASPPWIQGFNQGVDLTYSQNPNQNIAGGPWHVQNQVVASLTDARLPLHAVERTMSQEATPNLLSLVNFVSYADVFIEAAQRLAAEPWTHEVVVTRVP